MYLIIQPYGRRIFFDIAGTDVLCRIYKVKTKKEAEEIITKLRKYGNKNIEVYKTKDLGKKG